MKVKYFTYKLASVMKELQSSHVFFILQQAFNDDYMDDLQWNDVEQLLDEMIEKTKPKQMYKLPLAAEILTCSKYTTKKCLGDAPFNRKCKVISGCGKKWKDT